jgi:electron transfer flavoprotein-quinone oxidoreductase
MEKFDVIVVGAGPAGATAGMLLARAGLNVLIVERGQSPGEKNVSGGLLYSSGVAGVYPEFWKLAPVERAITNHQLVMLGTGSSTALDFRGAPRTPAKAYSVLRARLDPWLAQQAESAGAVLVTGVNVDAIVVRDGRVTGIQAGPDEIGADVVVIAEGTSALLLQCAGLQEQFHSHTVSLGIKEIVTLPAQVIEERFQCTRETGAACTLVGSMGGVDGGGFIYTNRDSLSVGVVVKIDALCHSGLRPHEILDQFKAHPFVARLIAGGEVDEYSAQTVHRGGVHLASRLAGDGYVVVGSAARLLLNNVFTVRGMDFAIVSAAEAARAILDARAKGSFDAATLARYETRLKATATYRDWQTFRDTYALMDNQRLFTIYPEMACRVMEQLMGPTERPTPKAFRLLRREMRGKVSLLTLARDLLQMGRGVAL